MPDGEGGSPKELSPQRATNPAGERATPNPFPLVMERTVFDKLSAPEEGWEPTYWPIHLMGQLEHDLEMKAFRERRIKLGEKAPETKSVEKVRMAYEIIAYPHLENPDIKLELNDTIRDALEHPGVNPEEFPQRAPITLNDAEVRTLGKLTQAMELPFDPDKCVYRYAELAPLREADEIVFKQSDAYKKAKQNAIDAGMVRDREGIEERTRLRQVEWDVEDSKKPPPETEPPKTEK